MVDQGKRDAEASNTELEVEIERLKEEKESSSKDATERQSAKEMYNPIITKLRTEKTLAESYNGKLQGQLDQLELQLGQLPNSNLYLYVLAGQHN